MGLFKDQSYPVAERLYQQGFYIPSGVALTTKQIEQSVFAIKNCLKVQYFL